MSVLLPLQTGIIYGPVHSRRLGRSLGINLLPPGRKTCTFDCVYCQYGWTPAPAKENNAGPSFPSVEEVVQAVETALKGLSEAPAYLTFSGNGEPTLHPEFPLMVEAVQTLRDRLVPKTKTAILSNAGRIGDPAVRRSVSRLDCPILKFDAGNEQVFRSFNRPAPGIKHEDILAGLERLPNLMMQSLFAAGPEGNIQESHLVDWVEIVGRIRPRSVQLYTLSRSVPCQDLSPAPKASLVDICSRVRRKGVQAEVF